tara:strand:+ start:325 stop:534 length:210 start_codon:yes stop_codon:yes gene_type:complete
MCTTANPYFTNVTGHPLLLRRTPKPSGRRIFTLVYIILEKAKNRFYEENVPYMTDEGGKDRENGVEVPF